MTRPHADDQPDAPAAADNSATATAESHTSAPDSVELSDEQLDKVSGVRGQISGSSSSPN